MNILQDTIKQKSANIGIVGCGFVGNAVAESYGFNSLGSTSVEVKVYDPDHSKSVSQLSELYACDAIFVCVPTPSSPSDGSCDVSILYTTLSTLLDDYDGIIVAKSTAPPSFYDDFKNSIAYVPEFLTQDNAISDYQNATRHIIGAPCEETFSNIVDLIQLSCCSSANPSYVHCSVVEASLFKYTANCMLATKVALLNEIFDYSSSLGCSWDVLSSLIASDSRLGHTHTKVPGPDGQRGFGGACFPKDMLALLVDMLDVTGLKSEVLAGALNSNKRMRLY